MCASISVRPPDCPIPACNQLPLPSDPWRLVSSDIQFPVELRESTGIRQKHLLKTINIRINHNTKVSDIFIAIIRQEEIIEGQEPLFKIACMQAYIQPRKGGKSHYIDSLDSMMEEMHESDIFQVIPNFNGCLLNLFSKSKEDEINEILKNSTIVLNALVREKFAQQTIECIETIENNLDRIETDDIVPYQQLIIIKGKQTSLNSMRDGQDGSCYLQLQRLSNTIRWVSASLCDYRNMARISSTVMQIFSKKTFLIPDVVKIISDYADMGWCPIQGAKPLFDDTRLDVLGPSEAAIIRFYTTIEGIADTNLAELSVFKRKSKTVICGDNVDEGTLKTPNMKRFLESHFSIPSSENISISKLQELIKINPF